MPTEITGKITDLHITFAYCEGSLCIKSEREVTYCNEKELRPYDIFVRFITSNETAINIIRKSDGEIQLKGYFVNDGDALIFEVCSAKEI